jgi:hypothetical protein
VANDALDSRLGTVLLEALEVRRIVVRRAPGARALREDLEGLAADRLGAVWIPPEVDTWAPGITRLP